VSNFSRRRSAVCRHFADAGAAAFLVTEPANVRYLTGFTGSNGWLLLAPGGAAFLTDPRYAAQAATEVPDLAVELSSVGLPAAVATVAARLRLRRLGYEPAHVTVAVRDKLEAAAEVEWLALADVVETQRRCKVGDEIDAVRAALALTEAALAEVAAAMTAGMTETEVAAALEYACRRRGAERMAFDTIVASGPRSALPHGVASSRCLLAGEAVMIDMGCMLGGYCSDITRMVWMGSAPDDGWRRTHELVDRARAAALATVAPGTTCRAVDGAAREVIAAAGLADAFTHGTGHGVGLQIHEAPALSGRSDDRLEAGMIVTIEPAVYLQGEYGVRIEDMVVVTDEGYQRLTTLSTEPILPKIS